MRDNQTLQWTDPASSVLVKLKSVGAGPAIERWSVMRLARASGCGRHISQVEDAMERWVAREVRSLFWPWWVLMVLAGLAPLLKLLWTGADAEYLDGIAVIGFFGGAAIVSASVFAPVRGQRLSSGKTVGPTGLWARKAVALAAAVFCAGVVACLAQTVVGGIVWAGFKFQDVVEPVLLLVVLVCSAAGWTSVARSVVGGLLLTGAAFGFLYLLIVAVAAIIDGAAPAAPGAVRLSHSPGVHTALMCVIVAVGLGYAGFMLYLGRSKFAPLERPRSPAA
jgi:hypothetical protein